MKIRIEIPNGYIKIGFINAFLYINVKKTVPFSAATITPHHRRGKGYTNKWEWYNKVPAYLYSAPNRLIHLINLIKKIAN